MKNTVAHCIARHRRAWSDATVLCVNVALCCSAMLLVILIPAKALAQANESAAVVTRYFEALQKADFRTVIDLTSYYQDQVSQIKAQNPQVLWSKLTTNFYNDVTSELTKNQPGPTFDPTGQIRFAKLALRPNVKWNVTETRASQGNIVAYVTLDYSAFEDAPIVDGKFIKEMILEVDVVTKSQLVGGIKRLPQGDTLWSPPLMIVNVSWRLEDSGGHLRAESIGGKAPFAWTSKCEKHLEMGRQFGDPMNQASVTFVSGFPKITPPVRCQVSVADAAGVSDSVWVVISQIETGPNPLCFVREPWRTRGEEFPSLFIACLNPVRDLDVAKGSASLGMDSPGGIGTDVGLPHGDTSLTPSDTSSTLPRSACGDYDSCMQVGFTTYKAKDWSAAKQAFQAAASQEPSKGEPWVWLGRILFMDEQSHQSSDLSDDWDKALSLGSQILIGACRELTLRPCERGDLSLGAKSVSFLANGSRAVFSAAPSNVIPGRILNDSLAMHVSYSLKVENKNYAIDFIPVGAQACQFNLMVQCPQNGFAEQLMLAQYVSNTLPKLAGGSLGQPIPASSPVPITHKLDSPAAPSSKNLACSQGVDGSYAILLQGHVYKVKLAGPAGPNQLRYFLDEKGAQVTDPLLVAQLATAVWTHDNVIISPDARNGSGRVAAILGTSEALQGYSVVQDIVVKGMVEAVKAVATDGASLSQVVPNLTKGVLLNQLKSAPLTIFLFLAQRGLEDSMAAYKEMEAILPPADATVFNAPDLVRVKALYLQARTLELPYEALASKLMPTAASQLTNQAFTSAIGALVPFVGTSNSAEVVTLNDLVNLQKSVANLSGSFPPCSRTLKT